MSEDEELSYETSEFVKEYRKLPETTTEEYVRKIKLWEYVNYHVIIRRLHTMEGMTTEDDKEWTKFLKEYSRLPEESKSSFIEKDDKKRLRENKLLPYIDMDDYLRCAANKEFLKEQKNK